MNKFTVLAPITLRNVKVKLTKEQFQNRMHMVRQVRGEDGVYEPITEVSFKAGEVIEVDMDVPKALHIKLAPVGDEEPAATGGEDSSTSSESAEKVGARRKRG